MREKERMKKEFAHVYVYDILYDYMIYRILFLYIG